VGMEDQIEHALERVQGSTHELDVLRVRIEEISTGRTQDMVLLRDLGVTREVIAAAAGVTPARVTQILGRVGESNRPRAPKVYVHVDKKAKQASRPRVPLRPEPHRHHYVSIAWNHARGNFLVRQKCECGDVRVIAVASLPKELTHQYADTSVSA
jgi:hypothetical protein